MTSTGVPPLTALAALVGDIAGLLQASDDPAARAAAASRVQDLQALVGQTATSGATFDLAPIADALAVFAAWLRAPSADTETRAERALADLQAALGPLVGWDPAREDAARRAQYRREARAALDDIFPDGLGGPAPANPYRKR